MCRDLTLVEDVSLKINTINNLMDKFIMIL